MTKQELVAIEKDAKENCGGNIEQAICNAIGAGAAFNRAGGKVPAFLAKEVGKVKGELKKNKK